MMKPPPQTSEEKAAKVRAWAREAALKPPAPEVWAAFITELKLGEMRRLEHGGEETAEDLYFPLLAMVNLLTGYDRSLFEYIKPLLRAVVESLEGKPHPLFQTGRRRKGGRTMSIDRQVIMGLCARAQKELRLARLTKARAADLVVEAVTAGALLGSTRDLLHDPGSAITANTVKAWHKKLAGSGDKINGIAQERFEQRVPGDTPRERAENILQALRGQK